MAIQDYPFHIVKDPTTITASIIGLALTPTMDGEALSSQDDALGPWVEHRTQVALNPPVATSGGLLTSFDVVAAGWLPEVEMRLWTPDGSGATDDLLLWAGMFSGRPDAIANPANLNVAAFRFQSSVPGRWDGVVNNGGANPVVVPMSGGSFAPGMNARYMVELLEGRHDVIAFANWGRLVPECEAVLYLGGVEGRGLAASAMNFHNFQAGQTPSGQSRAVRLDASADVALWGNIVLRFDENNQFLELGSDSCSNVSVGDNLESRNS